MNRILILVALLSANNSLAKQQDATRVLFIGNSYTYQHDLPSLIENLATADGRLIIRDQHTEGGWTLEKHWNSPETLALIRLGSWDAVIIQEYSTGLAKSDEKLCQSSYPFARNLIEEIRVHSPEAKIQFYQTWGRPYGEAVTCPNFPPNCEYLTMQDVITDNYSNYACQFQPAQVAPVGESFRYIRENEGDERFFELYETLGLADHHPSLQGSYLSACAHYLSLFGGSIRGNTFEAGLDPEVVAYLQSAADAVYSNTDWTFDNTCQSCKCECNQ